MVIHHQHLKARETGLRIGWVDGGKQDSAWKC